MWKRVVQLFVRRPPPPRPLRHLSTPELNALLVTREHAYGLADVRFNNLDPEVSGRVWSPA